MIISVHIDNMKDAERFSAALRNYPADITLKADQYCVDPKSILGVLAIMYSAHNNMLLDTGSTAEADLPRLMVDIGAYIRKE